MKYIDSSIREVEQTVAFWMRQNVNSGVREIRFQTGYFKLDGSSIVLPALKKCASEGAAVKLLIGSNNSDTIASHVAFIAGALGIPQNNVSIGIVSFQSSLFHPKAYHFVRNDGSQTAYVGSANLTGAGISGLNIEAGIILDTKESDPEEVLNKISGTVDAWFDTGLPGLSHVKALTDIDGLLASGLLSVKSAASSGGSSDEQSPKQNPTPGLYRLKSIFSLPDIELNESVELSPDSEHSADMHVFARNTEASFHYPQGTHLGHILAILFYFSDDRANTPFDDRFIRLNGSLGEGRLAAYRRQVKYKMLAAIELGLISDIRLIEDINNYSPTLTEKGKKLWSLLAPLVDVKDLKFDTDQNGDFSSAMPRSPATYTALIKKSQEDAENIRAELFSIVLNMPAVKQMLKFLYHHERRTEVSKSHIYEMFFQFDPVIAFCNKMGIEPATREGAKHRLPFLINLLDCCGIVSQSTQSVKVERLALSADLLVEEDADISIGERRYSQIVSQWNKGAIKLPDDDQKVLHGLFGDLFLTNQFPLKELVEIPK